MIYLITGNDFKKASAAFNRYESIVRTKQPEASVFVFNPEEFDAGAFKEVVAGETLFLNKHIVLARRLSESEMATAVVKDLAKEMAKSESIFIFLEPDSGSEVVKKLTPLAKEVKSFDLKTEVKPEFNIFSITDALGMRDRQALWVKYQEAKRAGVPAIEVFWKLLWQVKTMIIVSTTKDAQTTGLKPFVVGKALKASRNFKLNEMTALLRQLTQLFAKNYPESEEFAFGLEKIILNV